MKKMKSDLTNHERKYELFSFPDESLYLNVICGGIATYSVTVRLSDEEIMKYRDKGPHFLDDLAHQIAKVYESGKDRIAKE